MENLIKEGQSYLQKLNEAKIEAGRSEKGRLLAIATTQTELGLMALEKAGKE